MLVRELIEELQKFDGDMVVVICDQDCEGVPPAPEVQHMAADGILYQDERDVPEYRAPYSRVAEKLPTWKVVVL